jgi:hypothetical protein
MCRMISEATRSGGRDPLCSKFDCSSTEDPFVTNQRHKPLSCSVKGDGAIATRWKMYRHIVIPMVQARLAGRLLLVVLLAALLLCTRQSVSLVAPGGEGRMRLFQLRQSSFCPDPLEKVIFRMVGALCVCFCVACV